MSTSSYFTTSAASEIYKNSSVEVIGISPDPVAKQKEFVESNKIPVCTFSPCWVLLAFTTGIYSTLC